MITEKIIIETIMILMFKSHKKVIHLILEKEEEKITKANKRNLFHTDSEAEIKILIRNQFAQKNLV
jgi:hypothetical protein